MARRAFIHINGITYALATEVDNPFDPAFQRIERQVERLISGSGDQEVFDVLIEGHPAKLRVTTQGVFAASAFLGHEPPGQASVQRIR